MEQDSGDREAPLTMKEFKESHPTAGPTFNPNPNKRHTRGKRGNVTQLTSWYTGKQAGVARDRLRAAHVRDKKYRLRGKGPKGKRVYEDTPTGVQRTEARGDLHKQSELKFAASHRATSGMQISKVERRRLREMGFKLPGKKELPWEKLHVVATPLIGKNLASAVARYKRDGKLPAPDTSLGERDPAIDSRTWERFLRDFKNQQASHVATISPSKERTREIRKRKGRAESVPTSSYGAASSSSAGTSNSTASQTGHLVGVHVNPGPALEYDFAYNHQLYRVGTPQWMNLFPVNFRYRLRTYRWLSPAARLNLADIAMNEGLARNLVLILLFEAGVEQNPGPSTRRNVRRCPKPLPGTMVIKEDHREPAAATVKKLLVERGVKPLVADSVSGMLTVGDVMEMQKTGECAAVSKIVANASSVVAVADTFKQRTLTELLEDTPPPSRSSSPIECPTLFAPDVAALEGHGSSIGEGSSSAPVEIARPVPVPGTCASLLDGEYHVSIGRSVAPEKLEPAYHRSVVSLGITRASDSGDVRPAGKVRAPRHPKPVPVVIPAHYEPVAPQPIPAVRDGFRVTTTLLKKYADVKVATSVVMGERAINFTPAKSDARPVVVQTITEDRKANCNFVLNAFGYKFPIMLSPIVRFLYIACAVWPSASSIDYSTLYEAGSWAFTAYRWFQVVSAYYALCGIVIPKMPLRRMAYQAFTAYYLVNRIFRIPLHVLEKGPYDLTFGLVRMFLPTVLDFFAYPQAVGGFDGILYCPALATALITEAQTLENYVARSSQLLLRHAASLCLPETVVLGYISGTDKLVRILLRDPAAFLYPAAEAGVAGFHSARYLPKSTLMEHVNRNALLPPLSLFLLPFIPALPISKTEIAARCFAAYLTGIWTWCTQLAATLGIGRRFLQLLHKGLVLICHGQTRPCWGG